VSILLWEEVESRRDRVSIEQPSARYLFMVAQTFDDVAVRVAVENGIPGSVGPVGGVLPFQNYEIHHIGNGIWKVEVEYGPRLPRGWQTTLPGGQGRLWSFEIGTQSTKITQSKSTSRWGPPTAGNPTGLNNTADCQGAIGVNGDAVEGCEIDAPKISFQETVYYNRSVVDINFFNALVAVANAPVNNTPFRGRAAGEVRYLGTHGSERDYENWELTHSYAVSLNNNFVQVGPIGPCTKNGWDYLWVRYQDAVDLHALVKRPTGVYVEQVYDSSPFTIFDLNGDGTPGNITLLVGVPLGGS
jgi:hypothetical protein